MYFIWIVGAIEVAKICSFVNVCVYNMSAMLIYLSFNGFKPLSSVADLPAGWSLGR